jgi:hypothetical protein
MNVSLSHRWSSRSMELSLQALTDPYIRLSLYTAHHVPKLSHGESK